MEVDALLTPPIGTQRRNDVLEIHGFLLLNKNSRLCNIDENHLHYRDGSDFRGSTLFAAKAASLVVQSLRDANPLIALRTI